MNAPDSVIAGKTRPPSPANAACGMITRFDADAGLGWLLAKWWDGKLRQRAAPAQTRRSE
jgi:hypothetical protein